MDVGQNISTKQDSGKVVLFEDDHIILFYRPGKSSFSLITFSNYGFPADQNTFWGEPLCYREDIDSFGFVAKKANWFPSTSMKNAAAHVSVSKGRQIVTYGHSQGGYAALKYSGILNAAGIFSSCPQYSIDPSVVPDDPRYVKDFNSEIHRGMEIKKDDIKGQILIAFDPCDQLDKYHVDKIKALGQSDYSEFHIHHLGHDVMEVLVNRPLIMGLLNACILGTKTQSLYREARKIKKGSNRYGARLAERLVAHKKANTALRVLDIVKINNGGVVHPRDIVLLALARTKSYVALKDPVSAAEQMRIVTRCQPDNAHYYAYLGHCLVAGRLLKEAATAFTKAISLRPDVAEFRDRLLHVEKRLSLENIATG